MGSTTVIMGSAAYPSPMYDPFYSSYYYYSPFAYPYYWGPNYTLSLRLRIALSQLLQLQQLLRLGGGGYYGGVGGARPAATTRSRASPDSRGGDGVVVNGRGYTRVRPAGSSNILRHR